MKIITSFAVIGTAIAVAWTRYKLQLWEHAIHRWEEDIVKAPSVGASTYKQSGDVLPAAVQRYLSEAILIPEGQAGISAEIHTVRFSQTGYFFMDFKDEWTSFSAQQFFSANPPGFVWDASVALFPRFQGWPIIQVCDAWVPGRAGFKLALLNVWEIPNLLQADNKENQGDLDHAIELGEAMRWLAESFLIPTALLPNRRLVDWSPVMLPNGTEDKNKAMIRLADTLGLPEALLLVTFNETSGMPLHIEGKRPKWLPASKGFEMVTWKGFFEEFQERKVMEAGPTVYVPTHMKVGWIDPESGALELYFDGHNHDLVFSVLEIQPSAPLVVDEEIIPISFTVV